jgi:hypothetical protein
MPGEWVVGVVQIQPDFFFVSYPSLIREVQPLLEKYNASLYVNGHSHTLQHLQHNKSEEKEKTTVGPLSLWLQKKNSIDYFVVGCGAVTNMNRRNWYERNRTTYSR